MYNNNVKAPIVRDTNNTKNLKMKKKGFQKVLYLF